MASFTTIALDLVGRLKKVPGSSDPLSELRAVIASLRDWWETRLAELGSQRLSLLVKVGRAYAMPDWHRKTRELKTILETVGTVLEELRDANSKNRLALQDSLLDVICSKGATTDVQQLGRQGVKHLDNLSLQLLEQTSAWSELRQVVEEQIQAHTEHTTGKHYSDPRSLKGYCQPCRSGFLRLLELGLVGHVDEFPSGVGHCNSCGEPNPLFNYQVE